MVLDVLKEASERGEIISPLLPRANWIHVEGNFTPEELRALAELVELSFSKGEKNGNKN